MKMIQEFRAFAVRGNVIDLAVAVIIGGAFSGIVKSLVDDVIMPVDMPARFRPRRKAPPQLGPGAFGAQVIHVDALLRQQGQHVLLTVDGQGQGRRNKQKVVRQKRQPRACHGRAQAAAHRHHQYRRQQNQRDIRQLQYTG